MLGFVSPYTDVRKTLNGILVTSVQYDINSSSIYDKVPKFILPHYLKSYDARYRTYSIIKSKVHLNSKPPYLAKTRGENSKVT